LNFFHGKSCLYFIILHFIFNFFFFSFMFSFMVSEIYAIYSVPRKITMVFDKDCWVEFYQKDRLKQFSQSSPRPPSYHVSTTIPSIAIAPTVRSVKWLSMFESNKKMKSYILHFCIASQSSYALCCVCELSIAGQTLKRDRSDAGRKVLRSTKKTGFVWCRCKK
jgi:hypothetical protein